MLEISILGGIVAVSLVMCICLIQRYFKTKDISDLYFGIAYLLWMAAAFFGVLIGYATVNNNSLLTSLLYRISTTAGVLSYVFVNMFAVAITNTDEKMRYYIWIPLSSFLIITFIVWTFNPIMSEVIGVTTEFTLPSTYKEPIGPPLIETIIVLLVVMAIYPTSMFFSSAKNTKERSTKIKSLLIGVGLFVGTIAYAIEITGAIPYQYIIVYRLMILIGALLMFLGQFIYSAKPSIPSASYAFSKALKLDHKQMVGRKVLFEFDPASNYERGVMNFVSEAIANSEQIFVFTRKGSAIHSVLREHGNVKFFYLTQQLSIPKEISESELLLPSTDTSLMLGILDKTLRVYPYSVANVVFDNLSDLILSVGFDKTYSFMKYALEVLASPKTTVLFLLNKTAHDIQTTSNIRSLFSDQISYGKDGIQIIKLSPTEITMVETGIMPLERRE
jgi:hypothetical protein